MHQRVLNHVNMSFESKNKFWILFFNESIADFGLILLRIWCHILAPQSLIFPFDLLLENWQICCINAFLVLYSWTSATWLNEVSKTWGGKPFEYLYKYSPPLQEYKRSTDCLTSKLSTFVREGTPFIIRIILFTIIMIHNGIIGSRRPAKYCATCGWSLPYRRNLMVYISITNQTIFIVLKNRTTCLAWHLPRSCKQLRLLCPPNYGPPIPDQSVYHVRTQVWKTPLFANFGRKNSFFLNRNRWFFRPNKTLFFKQNAFCCCCCFVFIM